VGWRLEGVPHGLILLAPTDRPARAQAMQRTAAALMTRHRESIRHTENGDHAPHTAILVPLRDAEQWPRVLQQAEERCIADGTLAIAGEPCGTPTDLANAYLEALELLPVARRLVTPGVMAPRSLAPYVLLKEDQALQDRFLRLVLGPFLDGNPKSEQIRETLRAYLEHDGIVKNVVRARGIVNQTMYNHLNAVRDATGFHPASDRAFFELAFLLLDLREGARSPSRTRRHNTWVFGGEGRPAPPSVRGESGSRPWQPRLVGRPSSLTAAVAAGRLS
jgi:sugar diacid utilization regulator